MSRYAIILLLMSTTLACSLTSQTPTPVPATLIPIATFYAGTKTCAEIYPSAVATGKNHVVRPGESLSLIAEWYGKSVDELAQINNLVDASVIEIGQELIIEPPVTFDQGTLTPPLSSITIAPYPLYEGETSCLTLTTQLPTQLSAIFLDRAVPVISGAGGTQHLILIGVPLTTAAGSYPLNLSMLTEHGAASTTTLMLDIKAGGYSEETLEIENVGLLDPAIEQGEISTLSSLVSGFTPAFSGTMIYPINPLITSAYGSRRFYNGDGLTRYHLGMDFTAPLTTPINAAAGGTVVFVGDLNIRGRATIIDHGWGIYTLYAHQIESYVNVGDMISAGQVIGAVGSTGRSTGSHLHWEVWINGVAVNPMQWVEPLS